MRDDGRKSKEGSEVREDTEWESQDLVTDRIRNVKQRKGKGKGDSSVSTGVTRSVEASFLEIRTGR